jgi:hypothetical protein
MKYSSPQLVQMRFARMLLSALLVAMIFVATSLPVMAGSSDATQGTVQLDKIQQKTQEAIDSPANSMEKIEERSAGGLNEVQGTADYEKMNNSGNTKIPAVEKIEKGLDKAKIKAQSKNKFKK